MPLLTPFQKNIQDVQKQLQGLISPFVGKPAPKPLPKKAAPKAPPPPKKAPSIVKNIAKAIGDSPLPLAPGLKVRDLNPHNYNTPILGGMRKANYEENLRKKAIYERADAVAAKYKKKGIKLDRKTLTSLPKEDRQAIESAMNESTHEAMDMAMGTVGGAGEDGLKAGRSLVDTFIPKGAAKAEEFGFSAPAVMHQKPGSIGSLLQQNKAKSDIITGMNDIESTSTGFSDTGKKALQNPELEGAFKKLNEYKMRGGGLSKTTDPKEFTPNEFSALVNHFKTSSDPLNQKLRGAVVKSYGGGEDLVFGVVRDRRIPGQTEYLVMSVGDRAPEHIRGRFRFHATNINDSDIIRKVDLDAYSPSQGAQSLPASTNRADGLPQSLHSIDKIISNKPRVAQQPGSAFGFSSTTAPQAERMLPGSTHLPQEVPGQLPTERLNNSPTRLQEVVPGGNYRKESSSLGESVSKDINTLQRPKKPGLLDEFKTKAQETFQDSQIRVKKLQESKDSTVTRTGNPYRAEELFHGRVGARLEEVKDSATKIDQELLNSAKRVGVKDEALRKEVNEYLIAKHAPERNAKLGDGAAGMTTREAEEALTRITNSPQGHEVARIAKQIKDLNDQTLNVLKESGVIDDETYRALRETYQNHVPLNRVFDDSDDIVDALTSKGRSVRSSGLQRAKGSDREVSDILTNTVANLQSAIVRSEKNKVNLATLEFARNNKHLGIFEELKPKAIGTTFDGKPLLEKSTDPTVLVMKENGKTVQLKIHDERLAVALQGVGDQHLPPLFEAVNKFTRLYAGLQTRFNPDFAFSNIVRDMQEMAVFSASEKGVGFTGAAKTVGRQGGSTKDVIASIFGKDTPGARLYKQMQLDGGTTGGMGLSTRAQVAVEMEQIRKVNRSNPRKATKMAMDVIDNWNTVFEDSTRLSVYKEALDRKMSREQAASLAKNATINFNKKGTATPVVNALYMFSNASVQGSAKMLKAMKNPKVAAAVITTTAGSTFAVNSWNDKVDPEWRDKVSDYDRNANMVVMLPSANGDAKYITIPVSWGIKPIKVLADGAYDMATGRNKTPLDLAKEAGTALVDAYNPAGGTDLMSAFTPTIGDIPSEIARNKSWSGSIIRPDWLKGAPNSAQYFPDTKDSLSGKVAVDATRGLSKATGGAVEINPQDLLYVTGQLIGGTGRFGQRLVDTVASVSKGQAPAAKDTPFLNRFLKTKDAETIEGQRQGKILREMELQEQKTSWEKKDKATTAYEELKKLPPAEANKRIEAMSDDEYEAFQKVYEDKQYTPTDKKIKGLGVENGKRAEYIAGELKRLKTSKEKNTFLDDLRAKGLVSDTVEDQLSELIN